jgi:GNAT superfamily N-acetyltransferase
LIGPEYHRRNRALNRRALRASMSDEAAPGLLAFAENADPATDAALGWARLTPRTELDWLNRTSFLAPVDDVAVWSVACLYVRSEHRRTGVADALIKAAVHAARGAGAPAVEAYPIDASVPGATRNAFTGYLESFERAGFVEVARRKQSRPIVRVTF